MYNRDYVIDYNSYERNDLAVDSPNYMAQKHVYTAWGERLEQFTERGNWDRLLYVHEDVMGNTMHYTKATGQSFGELRYDVWGAPTLSGKLLNNDNGNFVAATFTGHIYDTVLDIYFAEARFYDAKHRQWLSSDPIKDGLNWYEYVGSNPTTYFDPNGLRPMTYKMADGAYTYSPVDDLTELVYSGASTIPLWIGDGLIYVINLAAGYEEIKVDENLLVSAGGFIGDTSNLFNLANIVLDAAGKPLSNILKNFGKKLGWIGWIISGIDVGVELADNAGIMSIITNMPTDADFDMRIEYLFGRNMVGTSKEIVAQKYHYAFAQIVKLYSICRV